LSKTGRIFGPEAARGQVARRIYIRLEIGGDAVDEQFLQSKSRRYWPMRLTSLTLRLSDRIALLGLIAIAMRGEGMLKSGGWVQSPPPVLTRLLASPASVYRLWWSKPDQSAPGQFPADLIQGMNNTLV
jgi:hypothetical protein